ncbi:MAG: hypothetical protein P0S94_03730, partial [Simkaniaceae bacterium]|nr:hypothetical protein [Simkaniaceae bacterium]
LEFAFQDRHISVLSHDDVHGWRGAFFNKMPGSDAEKFANVKLLLGMLFTYPGKKLTFMGTEFATKTAWNCKAGLNFSELGDPGHQGVQNFAAALGKLYAETSDLQGDECKVVIDDAENGIVGLLCGKNILAIHHYLPGEFKLPEGEVLLSSNAKEFGGSGIIGGAISTTILRVNG